MIIFVKKKKNGWSTRGRLIALIVAGVFLILAGVVVFAGFTAWRTVVAMQSHVATLQTDVSSSNFKGARAELGVIEGEVKTLRNIVRPLQLFTFVPYVGVHVDAAAKALDGGEQLLHAGNELLSVGEDVVAEVHLTDTTTQIGHLTDQQKEQMLGAIARNSYRLNGAQAEVSLARRSFDAIDTTRLNARVGTPLKKAQDTIVFLDDTLTRAVPAIDVLLESVGYPGQKTFLFLLQNNAEVRATGGFIGNYGILKIKNGAIVSFRTDNIYNIDDPAANYLSVRPPTPLARYFKTNKWFLRDSNWSPDFAETAQKAQWFYTQEGGRERLDGVIAITQDVMVSLLRITGPVSVAGITFDADNFYTQLQYQVEQGYNKAGIPESQRKEIVGELAKQIIEKIYAMPRARLVDLLTVFERNVSEKHILLYYNNPDIELAAKDLNWAGQVRKTDGDFVMVVDTNIRGLKTDAVMDKQIAYTVREDVDGSLYGKVDLYYTNNGGYTQFTGDYRDWVRILAPAGSVLVRTEGAMVDEKSKAVGTVMTASEAGKTSFGAYIVVTPKSTKHFMVEYKLPAGVAANTKVGEYTLLAQKQSGVSNQQLTFTTEFRRKIQSFNPNGFFNKKLGAGSVEFTTDLRVDREFKVVF